MIDYISYYYKKIPMPLKAVLLFLFLLFGIAWIAVKAENAQREACKARGGERVFSHTSTTYMHSNNMLIPITNSHYRCTK